MIFDVTQPAEGTRGLSAFAPKGAEPPGVATDKGEFSFWDLVDVINPLQHIPVVSSIYRSVTGDEIGAGARMAGGFLFGGVIGLGGAVANLALEAVTGDDVEGHILSLVDEAAPTDEPLQFRHARNAYERIDSLAGVDETPWERDIPC